MRLQDGIFVIKQAGSGQHQGEQPEIQGAEEMARVAREFADARGVVQNPLGGQRLVAEIGLQCRPEVGAEQGLLHHGAAESGLDAEGMEKIAQTGIVLEHDRWRCRSTGPGSRSPVRYPRAR